MVKFYGQLGLAFDLGATSRRLDAPKTDEILLVTSI